VIVLAVWFSASRIMHPRWGAGPAPGLFPETTVRIINELQPPGRIFNHYELGGYLAWMLQGNYQVFIDGRHYGMNRAFATHNAVMRGRPGWQRGLDRYGVNVIITQGTWSHEAQVVPLVKILAQDPEWGLIGRGERALLFFRKAGVPDVPEQYYLDKSEVWKQIRVEAEANIDMFPNQALAYQALGEALLGLGERKPAIEALRHYLRLAPDDQEAMKQLKQLEAESLQGRYNQ
jgi:tetratricopeptide (TPR) repeat protein